MFLSTFSQNPVIIAEAGINHNGSFQIACEMIEAAFEAGVDVIKFQTFKAYECASKFSEPADYQKKSDCDNQYEMLEKLELPFQQFAQLKKIAEGKGLRFLSTPDGQESLNWLCEIKVDAIKIASGEITNLPFLAQIAQKRLPILLSTGMSTIGEVEKAILTLKGNQAGDIILLHCTSEYPAPARDTNLRAIKTLADAFCLPTGFSDHTTGIEAAVAATALGACVIEKHFTLDRTMTGPDHAASLNPEELKELVVAVRKTADMLGSQIKQATPSERRNRDLVRRSLTAQRKILQGEILSGDMLCEKRPGNGIPPELTAQILGREVLCEIEQDQLIDWKHLGKVKTIDR